MSDLHREEMQKRYMPRNYGLLADIAKNDMNLKTSEVSFLILIQICFLACENKKDLNNVDSSCIDKCLYKSNLMLSFLDQRFKIQRNGKPEPYLS